VQACHSCTGRPSLLLYTADGELAHNETRLEFSSTCGYCPNLDWLNNATTFAAAGRKLNAIVTDFVLTVQCFVSPCAAGLFAAVKDAPHPSPTSPPPPPRPEPPAPSDASPEPVQQAVPGLKQPLALLVIIPFAVLPVSIWALHWMDRRRRRAHAELDETARKLRRTGSDFMADAPRWPPDCALHELRYMRAR
jgi:hypothetical protein